MQKLKFKGQSMPEYKGLDGKGSLLSLKSGDICEVTDETALQLLKCYKKDFELINKETPDHAPKLNKQLKKTAKFKSK